MSKIIPEMIERDECGYWMHSIFDKPIHKDGHALDPNEEYIFEDIAVICDMDRIFVSAEDDAPEWVLEKAFDGDVSDWDITRPDGDEWFCVAIFQNDDGSHALFVRERKTP